MKTKPIKPEEVETKKASMIPDVIIEAFNELIVENYTKHGQSSFKLKEVEALVESKDKQIADQAYEKGWYDVESLFKEAGWIVGFESPNRTETFDEYFVFEKND